MDQFREHFRLDVTNPGSANSYVLVTGIASGTNYTFEIRDSLWNNIPYTSAYVGGAYQLTPTGPLSQDGVTFSVLYNGVVAAKKTVECGILAGTYVRIL